MPGMAPKYLKTFLLIFISSKFEINRVWDELQRKLTQNKTEKLAFKPEFVLSCYNKQSSSACTGYI